MAGFLNRIYRASLLDAQLYEEVEADQGAMGQAIAVVVLSSVATGIGGIGGEGPLHIVAMTVFALVGWFIWSYLTYFIGVKVFPEPETQSNYGELLRTVGFSSSPGIARVIGILPVISDIIFFVTAVWMLVSMVIAVRQALDYRSTFRAVGVCIIGWVIQLALYILLFAVFPGLAKGIS